MISSFKFQELFLFFHYESICSRTVLLILRIIFYKPFWKWIVENNELRVHRQEYLFFIFRAIQFYHKVHLNVECECSGVSRNTFASRKKVRKGLLRVNEVYVNNEGGNEYQGDRVAANGECNARWRGAQKSSHPSSELQLPNYRETLYFLVPEILGFLCNFSLSLEAEPDDLKELWGNNVCFLFFLTQKPSYFFSSQFLFISIFL